MRYIQGVQSLLEVPFKKKALLYTFVMLLTLFNAHLLAALPTSADPDSIGLAFSMSTTALEDNASAPAPTIANILGRSPTTSTITVREYPTLTVNVIDVGIVDAGSTLVPEINNAPLSSIFVSPVGPSPSKADGLDILFSGAPAASERAASTTTLVMTSTLADFATSPSTNAAAASATAKSTPLNGHIVFECIALAALCILVAMLTSRIIEIYPHRRRLFESGEHVLRWLALIIPLLGLLFVASSVMLIDVWDDGIASRCYAADLICLIFYLGVKLFEYLFMIERAHQLRRRKLSSHLEDSWYLIEFLSLIIGFGVIGFFAFQLPIAVISSTDGLCRIGLPPHVAISILAYDVVFNVVLAVDFCVLAWKVTPFKGLREVFEYLYAALPFKKFQAASNEHQKIRKFHIGRVIWGLVAITIPTIANLYVLAYVHGREQGWLCLSVCTADITLGVIVIHWLTSKPSYSIPTAQQLPGQGSGNRPGLQGFQMG